MPITFLAGDEIPKDIQLTPAQPVTLRLIWPVGGEVLTRGSTYNITWDATGIDLVDLMVRLWMPDVTHTYSIAFRISAHLGIYAWTVQDFLEPDTRYTVRIDGIQAVPFGVLAYDESGFLTIQ